MHVMHTPVVHVMWWHVMWYASCVMWGIHCKLINFFPTLECLSSIHTHVSYLWKWSGISAVASEFYTIQCMSAQICKLNRCTIKQYKIIRLGLLRDVDPHCWWTIEVEMVSFAGVVACIQTVCIGPVPHTVITTQCHTFLLIWPTWILGLNTFPFMATSTWYGTLWYFTFETLYSNKPTRI